MTVQHELNSHTGVKNANHGVNLTEPDARLHLEIFHVCRVKTRMQHVSYNLPVRAPCQA